MRLFIAEKPSLARAIAENLPAAEKRNGTGAIICGDDVVTWCYGHILEQVPPDEYDAKYKHWHMEDLPIIPRDWKLKIKSSAVAQFNVIRKLTEQAAVIVNAGDPDREGQLLVDEVLLFVGNKKKVWRLLLNALDEKSIKYAMEHLQENEKFTGLYNSALARSRADWLVGMNLTRCYTIRSREAGYDGVVNVGRVQTPTMALVVRREDEILNFKPTTHYKVQITWQHKNGTVPTIWQMPDITKGLDTEGRLLDKKIAETLLARMQAVAKGTITAVEKKKKQEPQRLPYSLSALQIDAGKRYGYSPQQVLDAMQSLYEKKLTSYPRSDCEYLPENQFKDAATILANLSTIGNGAWRRLTAKADKNIKSRAWNDKKITAHHAIVPTTIKAAPDRLPETEKNLYMMTAAAYLAQFFPIHIYMATKITVEADGEIFVGTGKTIIEEGWKEIYRRPNTKAADNDDAASAELPPVKKGDGVIYFDGAIKENVTKPPKRFTPASLVEAMKKIGNFVRDENLKKDLQECAGIGTEATRAGIIEKLQTTGFFALAKKYLVPTEKARRAMTLLPDDITYPDITALWEKQLDEIAAGKLPLAKFFDRQAQSIATILTAAQNISLQPAEDAVRCPNCGKAMKKRRSVHGEFWGCSAYPKCRGTRKIDDR